MPIRGEILMRLCSILWQIRFWKIITCLTIIISGVSSMFVSPSIASQISLLRREPDNTKVDSVSKPYHGGELSVLMTATSHRDTKWNNDLNSESILSLISILKEGNSSASVVENTSYIHQDLWRNNSESIVPRHLDKALAKTLRGNLDPIPIATLAQTDRGASRCVHKGCQRIAIYGNPVLPSIPGTRRTQFCASHRRQGDVDLRSKRCQHPDGCLAPATYGKRGGMSSPSLSAFPSRLAPCSTPPLVPPAAFPHLPGRARPSRGPPYDTQPGRRMTPRRAAARQARRGCARSIARGGSTSTSPPSAARPARAPPPRPTATRPAARPASAAPTAHRATCR